MPRAERPVFDWCWFLACLAASSAWCLGAAAQLGATFDEPVYIQRGLEHWRSGSCAGLMQLGTMPLPVDVVTLPLHVWEQWTGQTLDPDSDWDALIPWARGATLLFWFLLLWYARLIGRRLGGPWAGRLAIAFLACEPSFLAHASLATTDVAISACLLALVYHFHEGRGAGWWRRIALPAFWYGAALLAKASGLAFGPLCMFVMEATLLTKAGAFAAPPGTSLWGRVRQARAALAPFFVDQLQILPLGLALTFVYCGSDWQPQAGFLAWARSLPDGSLGRFMVWLAEHLPIFSNAGEGLVRQVKHNMKGHGTYLLGRADDRSLWYYFPVLLTIKLSVPLLLAPLAVILTRARSLGNWACVTAGALVLFSLNCRVQLGIRLMLPLVALAWTGLAAALVEAYFQSRSVWKSRFLAGGAAASLLWTALAAALIWPHGLTYVNEFWSGSGPGYRLVSDANWDWGQGLRELVLWEERHDIDCLDVWYFGTDPDLEKLPLRAVRFHQLAVNGPEEVRALVHGRYLAVSTTLRYGRPVTTPSYVHTIEFLETLEPVAHTTTYLIYDIHRPRDQALRASVP